MTKSLISKAASNAYSIEDWIVLFITFITIGYLIDYIDIAKKPNSESKIIVHRNELVKCGKGLIDFYLLIFNLISFQRIKKRSSMCYKLWIGYKQIPRLHIIGISIKILTYFHIQKIYSVVEKKLRQKM